MLVRIDVRLDVLVDLVLVGSALSQYLEVLDLLELDHLIERLARLPVLRSQFLVLIKGRNQASFLLGHDVELANAVDRIGLLPYQLQISQSLQARG